MADESSMVEALDRAVALLGSEAALSRLIGKSQQAVNKMRRRRRPLSPEDVLTVEERTGISRHDLRPDIYGPPPALPAGTAEYEHAR